MRRIVPNIHSNDLEASKLFYMDFLGMELVMDIGWVITFASKENPTAQINIFKNDKPIVDASFISIEVSNVDQLYKQAQENKFSIVYELRNESWGVRRFFVKDPNGATINLLSHL
ncbi:VOC family protein [Muricauda ruestringensis]|mgnify:FL=1|uniref:VOC family protein n=1 Tax=Flagellimonas aurea TaxID=2915619 RepID=A0ABS3G2J3_9FLAO|nr:VOC family protein [Allomuricauda aurea]MBO0353066.1 VOC family protein [Allomuricauda aurea]|tara:strand:+ start:2005 stop:2349 length:345 start_codon:yes stop_codon:yes gene_type:complete